MSAVDSSRTGNMDAVRAPRRMSKELPRVRPKVFSIGMLGMRIYKVLAMKTKTIGRGTFTYL